MVEAIGLIRIVREAVCADINESLAIKCIKARNNRPSDSIALLSIIGRRNHPTRNRRVQMRHVLAGAGMLLLLATPAFAQSPKTAQSSTTAQSSRTAQSPTPGGSSTAQDLTDSQTNDVTKSSQDLMASQKIKQDLQSAGFTDVKVVAQSFVVQAKSKDGDPVLMTIGPRGMSVFEALNSNDTGGNQTTTGSTNSSTLSSSSSSTNTQK